MRQSAQRPAGCAGGSSAPRPWAASGAPRASRSRDGVRSTGTASATFRCPRLGEGTTCGTEMSDDVNGTAILRSWCLSSLAEPRFHQLTQAQYEMCKLIYQRKHDPRNETVYKASKNGPEQYRFERHLRLKWSIKPQQAINRSATYDPPKQERADRSKQNIHCHYSLPDFIEHDVIMPLDQIV